MNRSWSRSAGANGTDEIVHRKTTSAVYPPWIGGCSSGRTVVNPSTGAPTANSSTSGSSVSASMRHRGDEAPFGPALEQLHRLDRTGVPGRNEHGDGPVRRDADRDVGHLVDAAEHAAHPVADQRGDRHAQDAGDDREGDPEPGTWSPPGVVFIGHDRSSYGTAPRSRCPRARSADVGWARGGALRCRRHRVRAERTRRRARTGPIRMEGARPRTGTPDRRRRTHRGVDAPRIPPRRVLGHPSAGAGVARHARPRPRIGRGPMDPARRSPRSRAPARPCRDDGTWRRRDRRRAGRGRTGVAAPVRTIRRRRARSHRFTPRSDLDPAATRSRWPVSG